MGERVLVCGDRNWTDGDLIEATLREYDVEEVIEGEAQGADILGRYAAQHLGIPVMRFPADWDTHGRKAGPIRNRQMLTEGKPTLVLAFHDNIGRSKGTADMIHAARRANIPYRLISHEVGL